MPLQSLILLAIGASNMLMAIVIGVRNTKSSIHKLFSLTIIFNVLWAIGDALMISANTESLAHQWSKLFFIAPMLTALFLLFFTFEFTNGKIRRTVVLFWLFIFCFVLWVVLLPGLTQGFNLSTGSVNTFEVLGLNFLIYAMYFVALFNTSYYLLWRASNSTVSAKATQSRSMFWAALASSGSALLTNLLLPYLGNTRFVWLGPIFTVAYILIVSHSIARNKLFDIRGVVLRYVAYLFVLASLLAASQFALIVMFGGQRGGYSVLQILVVFLGGMLFRPLRLYFDKLTSKLFYRDAYNSQQEIDKLANIAVSEYKIDSLVQDSLDLVAGAVKPSTGKFILLDAHGDYYSDYKLVHTPRVGILKAIEILAAQNEQVFLVDEYGETNDNNLSHAARQVLYDYLREHDISMSVRLSTKDEVVGYLLFGPKLSGNIYSRQDKEFMSIAANEMSIAIQNARRFDEIQQFNETLKLEVERATSELRASNEKLQALDIAKDEFITMASHQLRTPLTSVKGYLSMVLEGDTGKVNKKQRDLLGAAFTSSQRMVFLIGDLLNVSRLQTGKFIIEATNVDLIDMIQGELEQLKETARSKKLKIKFNKPKDFPTVYLDETKTRQVIMNFVDNAIYYTPLGGKIEVNLEATDKKIEFTVVDNGIGVPKTESHNLFTKFYRAKNARKARPDGTGLGLFMAKKVIVDQGGAVIFHSTEGKGSTFGFTFPRSRVRPPKTES